MSMSHYHINEDASNCRRILGFEPSYDDTWKPMWKHKGGVNVVDGTSNMKKKMPMRHWWNLNTC
jgi:hypothetical protein